MTEKTEKMAATKTTKIAKEPKMTKTEQAEVKEQLGALIADATQPPPTEAPRDPVARDPGRVVQEPAPADSSEPKKEAKAKK